MNKEQTIVAIKDMFKKGYVPSRYDEPYAASGGMVNCFEHACLNLKNNQIEKLNLDWEGVYAFDFFAASYNVAEKTALRLNIMGLIMEPDKVSHIKLSKNQWRIALFYQNSFHFLLQEKDGTWSAKKNWTTIVEHFESLPEKLSLCGDTYNLHSVHIITNPYAESE